MADDGRQWVIDRAAVIGWLPPDPLKENKKGYIKMRCSCGEHMTWLHKTPSDPNYFRNKLRYMRRTCAS